MKTRILLATRVARPPVEKALRQFDDVELTVCDELADVPARVGNADVLVLSDPRGEDGRRIAAALKAPGHPVRWIQILTAGHEGLTAHGVPDAIVVTNQGGAVAPAVADHGMMMLLAMARRTADIVARSARHEWSKDFTPPLISLEGRTLAIVGYGHIGRQLARRAAGFDLRIVGIARSPIDDPLVAEAAPMSALRETLGSADFVALCVASSAATRHLFDARAFEAMKPGACFINLTRGETVDQVALKQALTSGRLAGAFIDVTEPEPLPPDDPLWEAPNLIISPHTAGAGGTRTGARISEVVTRNLRLFLAGEPLAHRIRP